MILTCPACGTQYVVKDGAIPEGGRKVRCASCRHSWHQDAPPLELDEAVGVDLQTGGDDIAASAAPPDFSAHAGPADESYPEERGTDYGTDAEGDVPDDERTAGDADQDAVADDDYGDDDRLQSDDGTVMDPEPPHVSAESEQFAIAAPVDDEFSPFAAREPAERKSRGPLVAMLLLFVLVAAVAALFWFLAPPEWKARVGLAEASGTPLQLMLTARDRQALASGNELLAVSGRVINPTSKAQPVPPIQAVLRSKSGEVVYRWTIAPPAATLAPGASAQFNSAEVNVPAGGEELTVSLGAPNS